MNDFLDGFNSVIFLAVKTIITIIVWIYIAANYPATLTVISFFCACFYLIREFYKFFKSF